MDTVYIVEGYNEFTITEVKKSRCVFPCGEQGDDLILDPDGNKRKIDNADPFDRYHWFTDKDKATRWRKERAEGERDRIEKGYEDVSRSYSAVLRALDLHSRLLCCDICNTSEFSTKDRAKDQGWAIANGQTFCKACGENI